jgi:2-dehydro-3-deoxyphosphooctonate aldolase (KDO 8-P synthase)
MGSQPLIWIAGPCVIESEEICHGIAKACLELTRHKPIRYFFKASFDKANRTSVNSFRGPGLKEGLSILKEIRDTYGVAITTDVHEITQVEAVAEVADVIQIPAFLCRQTDLLVEAGRSGRIVNVKKGQFLAPENARYMVEKVRSQNPEAEVWVSERGSSFGYDRLVVDFCGLATMKQQGLTVIMDATHAVQRPGGGALTTGGASEFVPLLAKAALTAGADGLFTEVHPSPAKALSDGPNSLAMENLGEHLHDWETLWTLLRKSPLRPK